jgi:hypothetical protein
MFKPPRGERALDPQECCRKEPHLLIFFPLSLDCIEYLKHRFFVYCYFYYGTGDLQRIHMNIAVRMTRFVDI